MKDGFLKIACVTPPLRVADCTYNADQIIAKAKEAAQAGAKLAAFPELWYNHLEIFVVRSMKHHAGNHPNRRRGPQAHLLRQS